MNNLNENETNKNLRLYNDLKKIMIVLYLLIAFVYVFRDNLYSLDNPIVTLIAGVSPNFISSTLFTLVIVFYILPFYHKNTVSIEKSIYLWLANIINIIFFGLIEYLHVILNLGKWDIYDMIASFLGIIVSTVIYYVLRKKTL